MRYQFEAHKGWVPDLLDLTRSNNIIWGDVELLSGSQRFGIIRYAKRPVTWQIGRFTLPLYSEHLPVLESGEGRWEVINTAAFFKPPKWIVTDLDSGHELARFSYLNSTFRFSDNRKYRFHNPNLLQSNHQLEDENGTMLFKISPKLGLRVGWQLDFHIEVAPAIRTLPCPILTILLASSVRVLQDDLDSG